MSSKDRIQRLLSIGITGDETQLTQALRRVDSAIKLTKNRTEEYDRALRALEAEFKAGAHSAEAYSRALEKISLDQAKHIQKTKEQTEAYNRLAESQKKLAQQQQIRDNNARIAARDLINGPYRDPGGYVDLVTGQYTPTIAEVNAAEAQRQARIAQQQRIRDNDARIAARDLMGGQYKDPGGYVDLVTGQYTPTIAEVNAAEAQRQARIAQQQRIRDNDARIAARDLMGGQYKDPGGYVDLVTGRYTPTIAEADAAEAQRKARAAQQQQIRDNDARIAARDLMGGQYKDPGGYYDLASGQYVPDQRIIDRNKAADDDRRSRGLDYMQQFETSNETRSRRLAEASRLHSEGAINARQHAIAVAGINREYSRLNGIIGGFKGALGTLFGPLAMTVAAGGLAYKTYQVNAEFEQAMARMTALTGSRGGAQGIASSMRSLTATAPVSFNAAMKSASTYMQYGGSAQSAPGMVKAFATLTGGDSEAMYRMALAFSQTQAAGRLMAQELNQMINAGFNPLMVISAKTGESIAALKKRMEEGAVSAREIRDAFKSATDVGGKFGNMLNELSDTLPGRMRRLQSEMEKLMTGKEGRGGIGGWFAHAAYMTTKGINALINGEVDSSFFQHAKDNYDLFGFSGEGAEVDAALEEFPNLNKLLMKDRKDLTAPQRKLVDLYRASESANAETFWTESYVEDEGVARARLAEFDKINATGDKSAAAANFVDMIHELGGEWFGTNPKNRKMYYDSVEFLENEAANKAKAEKDNAERLKHEKDFLDIQRKVRLEREMAFRESVGGMHDEIQYKKELITLGKEEADILKIMRDGRVDRASAEELHNLRMQSGLLDPDAASGRSYIPRAMQSGSQAEISAKAQAQSSQVAEQIRLQKEAVRIAAANLVANNSMNQHLQTIGTV